MHTGRHKDRRGEGVTGEPGAARPAACPVCGAAMRLRGSAAYYDQVSQYRTPVYECRACDVLCRDVDDSRRISHFYAATYVQDRNEEPLRRSRIGFFRFILSLVRRYEPARGTDAPGRPTLLDFGSAYGHLLGLAQDEGFRPIGIELNENLLRRCRAKGFAVYQRLADCAEKADAITAIDSLYCVPDARALIAGMRGRLKPGGLLLVRITNRNMYARLRSRFLRRGDLSVIGDATVSHSARSMNKLLGTSGFRIERIIPDYGRGKQLPTGKRLSYLLGYALTLLTLKHWILTPGIIVIARAEGQPSDPT